MSILLDAVTKSKQQQTEVVDPALSPRQQYAQLHTNNSFFVKLVVFAVAIIVAVIAAWWVATDGVVSQQQVINQPQNNVMPAVSSTSTLVEQEPSSTSDVELAGKSALPIAQVYSGSTPQPAVQAPNASSAAVVHSPVETVAASQPKPQPIVSDSERAIQQPIILGRQPTKDELAVIHADKNNSPAKLSESELSKKQQQQLALEALKRQLAAAASDVGLKTQEQQKQDELVKEIDTKLRNTEHQKSVRLSDKNDPMMQDLPKTKYQNVPSYGELPAGVQLQVPEFTISAHMYSTVPSQRRLSVNGQELKEGDKIKGKLKILEIRPRDVVLEIAGEKFKVPAI